MYGPEIRRLVLARHAEGASISAIHRELGPSRWSIRSWILNPTAALGERDRNHCFVCGDRLCEQPATYAYLLGQYLGDGYLVTSARIPRLRIACADAYPVIADEVDAAMHALSGNRPGSAGGVGCSDHYCYWMHWPCLFPQHGYFFANESADILTIMGTALDRVGVAWRLNRPNSISIARRDAVALMDQHVGPKR